MAGIAFPLKVGGIYPVIGNDPLAVRIVSIVGEQAFYIPHGGDGIEFGSQSARCDILSRYLMPDDVGPLPKIKEAIERAVALVESDAGAGDILDQLREALRWTA